MDEKRLKEIEEKVDSLKCRKIIAWHCVPIIEELISELRRLSTVPEDARLNKIKEEYLDGPWSFSRESAAWLISKCESLLAQVAEKDLIIKKLQKEKSNELA